MSLSGALQKGRGAQWHCKCKERGHHCTDITVNSSIRGPHCSENAVRELLCTEKTLPLLGFGGFIALKS